VTVLVKSGGKNKELGQILSDLTLFTCLWAMFASVSVASV
jgi:hypothetical protein